jgi:ankyrin repeat protein
MKANERQSGVQAAIASAKAGEPGVIRKWLDEGNDPNQYDPAGWTPLLWASVRGHHETVTVLLDHVGNRADISLPHRDSGALAIHMAGQGGDVKTAEVILARKPEHLDAVFDMNGHTALLQAAFYGHLDLAALLLKKGASTAITTARGLGPYDLAVQFQNKPMIDLIKPYDRPAEEKKSYYRSYLKKIAPVIPRGEEQTQALAEELFSVISDGIAKAAGNPGLISETLGKIRVLVEERRTDVNRLAGPLGQPPLIVTVTGNNGFPPNPSLEELRNRAAAYLIDHGADPVLHEKHPMGAQTIIRAAVFNHLAILKMCAKVLSSGRLADAINEIPVVNGLTAMHDTVLRATMAAPDRFEGYLEQTRFFIANGGRTDIEDFAGVTQREIADRAADPRKRERLLNIIDNKE